MMPGMPAQPVAPGMTGAPPQAPALEYADMSRDEMIAKLVEDGKGSAEELAAMSDEELQAMLDDSGEADGGGSPVEEMGDPASMPREEIIAELAAQGQDPAALEAMPDEELRALYAQVTGGATAAAPAAAPVVPMSEKTKPTQTVQKESAKLLKNLQKLNTFAERENRRLKAVAQQAKRRDAESFCEQLVKDGRVTVAQATAFVKPLLLLLDDSHPVHKFTEGGVTRKLSAFALKKRELAKLAPVIRFGERLSSDAPDGEAEVQKVEKFAEQVFPNPKARAKYVAEFKALKAAKPELTAKDYGVNPVHA
jgi:polyhydroxyalkanoate synthesis regulator phasin